MAEFNDNASTESAAPASSASHQDGATATSASSAGVSESTTQTQDQSTTQQTAAQGTEQSIDIGWQLNLEDDAEQTPADTIPESDDDLDQLSKEPGLDQVKVPGLVDAIRTARKNVKERSDEVRQLREQLTQRDSELEEFGGVEGIKQLISPLTPFLHNQPGSAEQLLTGIWRQSEPAYTSLIDALVEHEKDYILKALDKVGALPESTQTITQTTPVLTSEQLAKIPEHLRETAKRMAVEQPAWLEDVLIQNDELRNFNLERELKLSSLDQKQQDFERQQWSSKVEAAQTEGTQSFSNLTKQYEATNYRELAKWTPFGKENTAANQRLYRNFVEGAFSELLQDKTFGEMYADAERMLAEAPLKRLHGQAYEADTDERNARKLAFQFNARLGQVVGERVKEMSSIFSDAFKWRESQRKDVTERKEIPGQGLVSTPNGAKVSALNAQGKISDEFIDHIVAGLPR